MGGCVRCWKVYFKAMAQNPAGFWCEAHESVVVERIEEVLHGFAIRRADPKNREHYLVVLASDPRAEHYIFPHQILGANPVMMPCD